MPQTPSVEPVVQSRLLPRISFQSMLALMAVSAVVLAVASAANQGGRYATAAALGVGFLVVTSATLMVMFLLAWCVANLRRPVGVALLFYSAAMTPLLFSRVAIGWLNDPVTVICTFLVGIFLVAIRPPKENLDKISSPFAVDQLPPQILPPRDPHS